MARYFMHVRDGTDEVLDPVGEEFSTLEALKKAVLISVRDLMSGDIQAGVIDFKYRIDAEDEGGSIVYTLPFRDAVQIIFEDEVSAASVVKQAHADY